MDKIYLFTITIMKFVNLSVQIEIYFLLKKELNVYKLLAFYSHHSRIYLPLSHPTILPYPNMSLDTLVGPIDKQILSQNGYKHTIIIRYANN